MSKIIPLQEQRKKDNAIFYVGIAYDEKDRMSKVDNNIKYPLVEWGWTEADCVDYLNKNKILNPLYVNFNRLGCWMCPKQGSGSLYVMWKLYPELWERMKKMEKWQAEKTGLKLYTHNLKQIEFAYKKGYIPPKLPKYGCSHGCESVKNAFKEYQCNLSNYEDKYEK